MSVRKWILLRGEKLVWVSFLALLLILSFTSASYQSEVWMRLSLALYIISVAYLLLILAGLPCNISALRRGGGVILVMVAALIWLYAQTVIPFDHQVRASLSAYANTPAWFDPGNLISVDPLRSHWLLYGNLTVFSIMLLSVSMIRNRSRLKQMLYLLMLAGAIHAISGVSAKYAGVYLVDRLQLDGHWSAARGWFINRNHFAAFLIMCMAGAIPFFLRTSGSQVLLSIRSLSMVSILLSAFAIILSQSRSGIISLLALLAMALVVLPMLNSKSRMLFQGNSQAALKYAGFGLLLLIMASLLFGHELVQRLSTSFLGLGERKLQWEITLQAIQQSPWVGYGGGSYASIFQFFRDYADLRQVVFDQSHNDYLHIWLEQGLVGLALWITTVLLVLYIAYKGYSRARSSLVAGVLAGASFVLIAGLIQALVDFNLQIISLRCYFFAIIGILLAAPSVHSNSQSSISKSFSKNYE